VPTLTALAVTMAAIASQSADCSDWPSTTRPVSAANTGLTLMKTPKNLAGTRRRASRSATMGTAEHMTPAVAARPRATAVTGWLVSTQIPTGMYSRADRPAAAAGPWVPGSRAPTTRFTTMYPAQQRAASRARKMPT
jgi:hypothetical protein